MPLIEVPRVISSLISFYVLLESRSCGGRPASTVSSLRGLEASCRFKV